MKTNEYPSSTAVALELELELRASGEALREARARLAEAETRAALALRSAQRTDGVFRAITSAVGAGLQLASALEPMTGPLAPAEDLAVARETCSLLGRFAAVTDAEVGEAQEVASLLRARGRSMGRDEAALDVELDALRGALIRHRGAGGMP